MGSKFDSCSECGKEFKRMWVSDPRKGYDVLNECATAWRIQCKACGHRITVQKEDRVQVNT